MCIGLLTIDSSANCSSFWARCLSVVARVSNRLSTCVTPLPSAYPYSPASSTPRSPPNRTRAHSFTRSSFSLSTNPRTRARIASASCYGDCQARLEWWLHCLFPFFWLFVLLLNDMDVLPSLRADGGAFGLTSCYPHAPNTFGGAS